MDLWRIELWCLALTAFLPGILTDPCSAYDTMTGDVVRRSSAYILTPADTAICDNFLDEKWYRLDSLAGNNIVQTCPSVTHCGTLYPLWMNGTLPLVSEGEVDRTVCQSGFTGCCESSLTIQVRNCGIFNVYYLRRTSGCPIAYCFGTQLVTDSTVTQESTEETTEVGTSGTQFLTDSTVTQESTEQTNAVETSGTQFVTDSTVTQESTEETTEVGTSGTQFVNQSTVTVESTSRSTEVETNDYSTAGMDIVWILLGIIVFLLIAIAITAAFFVWKHRHNTSTANEHSMDMQRSNLEEQIGDTDSNGLIRETTEVHVSSVTNILDESRKYEDSESQPEPVERGATRITITNIEATLPNSIPEYIPRKRRIAK